MASDQQANNETPRFLQFEVEGNRIVCFQLLRDGIYLTFENGMQLNFRSDAPIKLELKHEITMNNIRGY